jgi:ParB family chromosome partitioning protein
MTRGLGRGLDALLGSYSEDVEAPEVMLLPVQIIRANPNQPRKDFDEEALKELSDSIRSSGLLQPILVRPVKEAEDREYEIVAGERRLRAGKLAGLEEVPCIVREIGDDESLAIALIENLQREDLNVVEEARGLAHLQKQFGMSQEELADKVGKSRSAVTNILRLLQLPDEILEDMRVGKLTAGHGRALLAVEDDKARLRLRKKILNGPLSVREAEAAAAYFKRTGALPGESAGKKPRSKGARRSEALAKIQDALNRTLTYDISLTGDVSKGKITFSYSDEQQLMRLMAAFGVEEDVKPLLKEKD